LSSFNQVMLIGNLGADPEVKSFANGGRVANFSVATSEKWKDKASGEPRERTEWHRIVVQPDGLVGVVEKYLRKGSKVHVVGQLQTRKWTGSDGVERYATEVVIGLHGQLTMLDGANRDSGAGGGAAAPAAGGARAEAAGRYFDGDDDVPF